MEKWSLTWLAWKDVKRQIKERDINIDNLQYIAKKTNKKRKEKKKR